MVKSRAENTKIPWNSGKSTVRQSIACEVDDIILNTYKWDFTQTKRG